jgi:hypothetical protein
LESGQSSVQLKENDHAFVMFVDHQQLVFVVVVTESYPTRYIFAADGSGMIDGKSWSQPMHSLRVEDLRGCEPVQRCGKLWMTAASQRHDYGPTVCNAR